VDATEEDPSKRNFTGEVLKEVTTVDQIPTLLNCKEILEAKTEKGRVSRSILLHQT
jgi:hypothetical protein